MKVQAPEHTEEISAAGADARKTAPISGEKPGSTQSLSGNGRSSSTVTWTASVQPGERTETITVSRLARLSATARFRIFPGSKDMDTEIREAEKVSYMPEMEEDLSSAAVEEDLPPVSGQYEQGSPFAAGGRSILRTARDRHLHRLVAIKSLRKEFAGDPEHRTAFLKEAKITALLDHPGVIPVYSLSSDEGNNLFLSMKYIKGHTFKYYLEMVDRQYAEKGVSQFDSRKALFSRLELFLRVCDAIEYAHSRNIMHCDLKPENIMLGEYREVYVVDWGLARPIRVPGVTRENWVRPEKITGTPRYLSPEAVSGQYCDERSDLYALGLILHETITLTNAVPGETRDDLMIHIRDGELAPIRHKYGVWIDNDLRAIIRKATARNLADRYHSVAELSADLRRYLRDEEVEAQPDHFLGKLVRLSRRHPGSALLLTFVMLVIAGSAMTYTLVNDLNHLYENSERDYALGESYIRCVLAARDADRLFLEQKQTLDSLSKSFELLLDKKLSVNSAAKAALPGNTRRVLFTTDAGALTPDQKRISHLISLLVPNMESAFLKNSLESLRKRENKSHIVPCGFLYSFDDGLSAVFPADAGEWAAKKDDAASARPPDWVAAAEKAKGEYVWMTGKAGSQDVFYCVRKLETPEQTLSGAMALVAQAPGLIRLIRSAENDGGRYLLDEAGNILLSSEEARDLNPRIRAAVLQRKYGYISSMEKGRKMLWCFNSIPSTGWFFLEKLPVPQGRGK